jgi:hypothetical protein
LKEEDIGEVVEDSLNVGREVDILNKVNHCADRLNDWGRRKRMRFKQEIAECNEEMERLRGYYDLASSNRYRELQGSHATLLVQEETYWRQRAKMHWLKEGDLNTNFFHLSTSIRSKSKKIDKLVTGANVEVKT